MLDNLITFQKYSNVNFDFNDNLRIKDSLMFIKCINCKINKITIKNCSNFNLTYFDTISGIDIDKSNEITIRRIYKDNTDLNLNYINCFMSKVKFCFNNLIELLDVKFINENSEIVFES